MITKETIQQRRQEIAEEKHAYSVFRDIQTREKDRSKYEKRWFWELLQNAKDAVAEDEKVSVSIIINDNEIDFYHSGNPFELDDILSLIIQGSSKPTKKGMTGRFGTGFMTTYLLSKKVQITGKLMNDQGSFDFQLDREASDPDAFYALQKTCNELFEDSLQMESYLPEGIFQTRFKYLVDEKGKKTVRNGLNSLDQLIPFTQAFNDQFESIELVENGIVTKYTKENESLIDLDGVLLKRIPINTEINGVSDKSFNAYVFYEDNYEVCFLTTVEYDHEEITALDNRFPKLYFTFPLIGSEELGIPFVINSREFDPRTEREGIYLIKSDEDIFYENTEEIEEISITQNYINTNRVILETAIHKAASIFINYAAKNDFISLHRLFEFKISYLEWVDNHWLTQIKKNVFTEISNLVVIKTNNDEIDARLNSFSKICLSYSEDEKLNSALFELLNRVKSISLPESSNFRNWLPIAENLAKINDKNIFEIGQIWGIKRIIDFVERIEDYKRLTAELENGQVAIEWLNDFYLIVREDLGVFPLDKSIILNQQNMFVKAEGKYWDDCNDDELFDISDLIGLNFRENLISNRINRFSITGVSSFSLEEAIQEIKAHLNDNANFPIDDKNTMMAHARFLKWLISKNKSIFISDLKVITGEKSKDDDCFITLIFPKGKHLLLSPKVYFEDRFSYYSTIIRDRDCLHHIYNDYLTQDEYLWLEEKGYIHSCPLVIRNEVLDPKSIDLLISDPKQLSLIKDEEGNIKQEIKISYSDFAYLTTTDGHIYNRNTTQKSSLERFKFFLLEAVNVDPFFTEEPEGVKINESEETIKFEKSMWLCRARNNQWINVKNIEADNDKKFLSQIPNSKNLAELIKEDTALIKSIRGEKQVAFLTRLGIGVSDLIRNTLPSDDIRLRWDKALTNMITSDADPELVQEIFNDPNIKSEYQRRLNEKKLILRNQDLGSIVEELFKEIIEDLKQEGYNIDIERKPYGSDYLLTEESSDWVNDEKKRTGLQINEWFVELKATGKNYALMTTLQAHTAVENKINYALVVVPLAGYDLTKESVKMNARVVTDIGQKLETVVDRYDSLELEKIQLNLDKEGVSVSIEDREVRFSIRSTIWNDLKAMSIKDFVIKTFRLTN